MCVFSRCGLVVMSTSTAAGRSLVWKTSTCRLRCCYFCLSYQLVSVFGLPCVYRTNNLQITSTILASMLTDFDAENSYVVSNSQHVLLCEKCNLRTEYQLGFSYGARSRGSCLYTVTTMN